MDEQPSPAPAAPPSTIRPIRRALISVYDKSGLVDFARALHDEFGIEIISTGGTAKTLREAGIPVTLIENITGFPEMLDGRVKTLHPKIHAAILADRDNLEHMRQLAKQGIEPIDMVVVNLYPFEKTVADPHCTFEQAIEMIDIGGVALLRAAAKNHKHVLAISSSDSYGRVLSALREDAAALDGLRRGELTGLYFRGLDTGALGSFLNTALYDSSIAEWISGTIAADGAPYLRMLYSRVLGALRYGENPHQTADVGQDCAGLGRFDLTAADAMWCEQQPRLSYNNYVDADAALGLCAELARAGHSASVYIKHTNACGVGLSADPIEACRRAYLGDPNAAMGGVLAVNFGVTPAIAEAVMDSLQRWGKSAGAGAFFVEVWIAPEFDKRAVEVIRTRKKWGESVRLLDVGDMTISLSADELQYRSIAGGVLVQTPDVIGLNEEQWKLVTKRAPSAFESADLRLAWLICKHTKSNAISIVKDGMLIGNGAGQMSRVMSCRIATWLAKENGHSEQLAGSVAASDAFFPFRDGPEILIDAGVTAIIQPGGSKRDDETIAACEERGVAMIFTGTRHFRH